MAEASTMFLTINLLMALSFGTSMAEDSQRTRRTCPRPCLLRPPFLRFLVIFLAFVVNLHTKNHVRLCLFKPRKNSLHLSYEPTTLGSIIESNTTEIQHKIIVISIHNAQENQHGDKEASTRSSRRFDGLPIQQTELRILLISRLDHSQRKRICYDSAVVWTPSLDPSKETPMSMRQEAENSATRFLVIPSIHTQINTLVPLIIKL